MANLSVATSETWRDKNTGERKEKTEWHRVVIFSEGSSAVAEQYLKKGTKVYLEGPLQTRKWQDQSGQDKYSTEVVLQGFNSNLTMLDGRGDGRAPTRRRLLRSARTTRSEGRRRAGQRRRLRIGRHGRRHPVLRTVLVREGPGPAELERHHEPHAAAGGPRDDPAARLCSDGGVRARHRSVGRRRGPCRTGPSAGSGCC